MGKHLATLLHLVTGRQLAQWLRDHDIDLRDPLSVLAAKDRRASARNERRR